MGEDSAGNESLGGRSTAGDFEAATYAKIAWRLIPLLFVGYFLAFLDRVNVGFAKLQMASDLSLSDEVYGFGAGIFFIGYFLFEVPSNMVLRRVGARRWIARIMISWGLISAAFMFAGVLRWGAIADAFGCTDAEFSFYLLRFLLGAAEAGFYPGVILYLTFWFPAGRRAHVIALFMTAIALSNVVGSPLSGGIMQVAEGMLDWRGWQWLFLIEGVPAIIVGFLVLLILPDGPETAEWLEEDERALVTKRLEEDENGKAAMGQRHRFSEVLLDLRVWVFILAYFGLNAGFYALNFWLPTIIQEFGIDQDDFLSVGLIAMVPWGVAAVSMVVWARHSDRTNERRWHATLAALLAALGLLLLATNGENRVVSLAALAMVTTGGLSWLAVYWSFPTSFLSGAAAAAGIAMINSFGNLGGYFGPTMIGAIRTASGGDSSAAFLALSAAALMSAVLSYAVPALRARPAPRQLELR